MNSLVLEHVHAVCIITHQVQTTAILTSLCPHTHYTLRTNVTNSYKKLTCTNTQGQKLKCQSAHMHTHTSMHKHTTHTRASVHTHTHTSGKKSKHSKCIIGSVNAPSTNGRDPINPIQQRLKVCVVERSLTAESYLEALHISIHHLRLLVVVDNDGRDWQCSHV